VVKLQFIFLITVSHFLNKF